MKKGICIIIAVMVILTMLSVSVFACTVGDDALQNESALVFIGTLEEYSQNEKQQKWSGKAKVEERIKGDVTIGETITIKGSGISSKKFEKDTFFLFISFPNSQSGSTYIFSIVEKQGDQILLYRPNDFDNHLQDHVERYINDGSYAKAEAERASKLSEQEKIALGENNVVEIVSKLSEQEKAALGENNVVEREKKPDFNYGYLIPIAAAVIISGVAVVIAIKKKRKES